jgi:CBS domain-containing protein
LPARRLALRGEAAMLGLSMKRNEPVSKIMATEVQTVHAGQKLSEVRRMLGEGRCHSLPVVEDDELRGLVTDVIEYLLAQY